MAYSIQENQLNGSVSLPGGESLFRLESFLSNLIDLIEVELTVNLNEIREKQRERAWLTLSMIRQAEPRRTRIAALIECDQAGIGPRDGVGQISIAFQDILTLMSFETAPHHHPSRRVVTTKFEEIKNRSQKTKMWLKQTGLMASYRYQQKWGTAGQPGKADHFSGD